MKTFNVLYIDDDLVNAKEKENKIDPLVRGLSSQRKLKFLFEYPIKLEPFVDLISEEYKNIDAIMIDLKLNENHQGKSDFATYPAQILATAIRTYQNGADKKINEFPLFLISSIENRIALYDTDVKSHDLFDLFISKNDIAESGIKYENQISAIIQSYQEISSQKFIYESLNIDEVKFNSLNINYDNENELISTTSQFIFNEIIKKNGVLINEEILAARLGIDFKKSRDWIKLLKILESIKYKGVFSNVWSRWWANDLLEWWESSISASIFLINSTSSERVKSLKEILGLNHLVVAEPIEEYMNTSFWTVCKALKKPLDIYDGLVVNTRNEVWQDKVYVSPTAVYEGISKAQGIKLHPSEKERYEELKKIYKERKYDNK